MAQNFHKSRPLDWNAADLEIDLPKGQISYGAVQIFEDRIGRPLSLPVIAIQGLLDGPVLGITAAVHGNEINGIPTIHRLSKIVNPANIRGTLIAIPIVNLPGYLAYQREFIDGVDLNRIMPGNDLGTPSEVYAANFTERILKYFEYHLDLHTASFGRINSHYIRANLKDERTKTIAELQHADIVLHADGPVNSVRDTAMKMGIPSITLELGNPQSFQQKIVDSAILGLRNVMIHLQMIDGHITQPATKPIICHRSYWTRCHDGGILKVHSKLRELVPKGRIMATLSDIYGRKEIEYPAPESGVVIGKNINPVVSTGDRILHLGISED